MTDIVALKAANAKPRLSAAGMLEILSHEGICLEPYLDSVGVWTIGAGQTKSDGFDPKTAGKLTIKQVFDLFKLKIKQYTDAVDALGLNLTQYQYDALTSLCYNFGPGNLRSLCRGRTIPQIGEAIMLYTKPKEITERREKERRLFKSGVYSNVNGKVLVFPVVNNHPRYSAGYYVDARPYLIDAAKPPIVILPNPKPIDVPPVKPSITSPAKGSLGAFIASIFAAIFKRK
jgi:lysozyme